MEVHHHHHQQQRQYYLNVNPDPGGEGGDGSGGGGGGERDRFPQWSHAETKEFLAIRAELDRSFLETKRNRHLWAAVSSRMAAKGFHRTPDHFDEAKQGAVLEDDDMNEPCGGEEQESSRKKRKIGASSSGSGGRDLESTLREFMRWHVEMEGQRLQAAEAREMERAEREMEWRRVMEALAMERVEMDRRWREREEDRRVREEARAERRDALVTALLNKLAQKGL
ncbi:hypothetical protein Taro_029964 [Colocasia esculenta]|uniref:Myb/SANT-like DNA-binding domain-containing protein n=1 Tax=Colocasia esculenta TaxID=4460 RepID=A0A843VK98_COLES|nr:hypothetical protein [Colocasia esculenta]